MKKQTDSTFLHLSKEQAIELANGVNETITSDFIPLKIFGIVDLWNIQRNSKTSLRSRKSAANY